MVKMFTNKQIKSNQDWLEQNNPMIIKKSQICYIGSDPTRLKIVYLLMKHDKVCVGDIAKVLNLSMSAVSHQLAKLDRYQVVKSQKSGRSVWYSLKSKGFKKDLFK